MLRKNLQVKLILGGLALCPSLKIPFILLPPLNPDDPDPYPCSAQQQPSRICSVSASNPEGESGESESANKTLPSSQCDQVQVAPECSSSTTSCAGKQEQDTICTGDTTSTNYDGRRRSVKVEVEQPPPASVSSTGGTGERETKLSLSSTSSTPTVPLLYHDQLTLHEHQPQIHHHHLATTPATTPSPVRASSSGTHLFHQQTIS